MRYGNDCDVEPCNDVNDNEEDEDTIVPHDEDGYMKLQDLSMDQFRKKLIIHFNIAFTQNKLVWPTRNN